jgi:hypothetical protein
LTGLSTVVYNVSTPYLSAHVEVPVHAGVSGRVKVSGRPHSAVQHSPVTQSYLVDWHLTLARTSLTTALLSFQFHGLEMNSELVPGCLESLGPPSLYKACYSFSQKC